MNLKGLWSWLLLVLLLAVPLVLGWYWWQASAVRPLAVKPKPVDAGVFGKTGLPSTGAVAAKSVPTPATEASPKVSSAPISGPIPAQASAPPSGRAAAVPSGLPTPGASQARAGVAVSSSALEEMAFHPKTDRDPLMSPFDKQRQEDQRRNEREALEKIKEAALRARSPRQAPKRPAGPPIDQRVKLMAIINVDRPDAEPTAIVNDVVVARGALIPELGVRVVKIGTNSVTFEYRGKKFVKTLRQ